MSSNGSKLTPTKNGHVLIDDVNDRVVATDVNKEPRVYLGLLPDGSYGIAYLNASGKVITTNNGATEFKYDASGINYQQNGLLPDGSYGLVIAKPGINVASLFS